MKIVTKNPKAWHAYEILEKIEAGLVLVGSEVKSARAGRVQLGDAYARFRGSDLYVTGLRISPYESASWTNHEPDRPRRLLLHRRQLKKIRARLEERGLTLVVLDVHWNDRGILKIELGLGRGRKMQDKREKLKKRAMQRDAERAIRARTGR